MKKLLVLMLALCLVLPAASMADVDLSGLSFDELVALREQLNLAIWNSQEWQSVTVPIGVWEIGKDIPAGHWTISVSPDASDGFGSVYYTDKLDYSGQRMSYDGYIHFNSGLYRPDVDENDFPKSIDIECKEKRFIIIEYTPMVFTPYTGKPDLGFH